MIKKKDILFMIGVFLIALAIASLSVFVIKIILLWF